MQVQFTSQLKYGDCGALICTPVCCLVASSYLMNNNDAYKPAFSLLTSEYIDKAMRASHAMYKSHYDNNKTSNNNKKQMMMVHEIQHLFPKEKIKFYEVAGMTRSGEKIEIEDLFVCPLHILVKELLTSAKKNSKLFTLIVTYLEHTKCYLFDKQGNLFLFDPLPAFLRDVTFSWDQSIPSNNIEYSALLLTPKTESSSDI